MQKAKYFRRDKIHSLLNCYANFEELFSLHDLPTNRIKVKQVVMMYVFLFARSVTEPFRGDYVQLRKNAKFKSKFNNSGEKNFAFADVVNKVDRKNGKFRQMLFLVTPTSILLMDQKTLESRSQIALSDIKGITVSPYSDYFIILHVKKVN